MELDSVTIIATAAVVAGLSGAFMLVAGGRLEQARPTTIWGVANLFIAVGMMLILNDANFNLAFLSGIVASALTLLAATRFNEKHVPVTYFVAGLTIWTVVVIGPWTIPFGISSAILLATIAAYFAGTAFELWTSRSEALPGRWPVLALVLIMVFGVSVAAGVLLDATEPPPLLAWGPLWVAYISTVAFTVGTSMFFVAMTKERAAADHELAAVTDSLTGLANRRALLVSGAEVLAEALDAQRPVALVVFDLDRFKSINDSFGHRIGDAVLRRFVETAVTNMRATDLIGRIGGEEFVAVLPGAPADAAVDYAERVRKAFAEDSTTASGQPVMATVSSGIAVALPGSGISGFSELLDRADAALYLAKASGRDRVVVSNTVSPPLADQPTIAPARHTRPMANAAAG